MSESPKWKQVLNSVGRQVKRFRSKLIGLSLTFALGCAGPTYTSPSPLEDRIANLNPYDHRAWWEFQTEMKCSLKSYLDEYDSLDIAEVVLVDGDPNIGTVILMPDLHGLRFAPDDLAVEFQLFLLAELKRLELEAVFVEGLTFRSKPTKEPAGLSLPFQCFIREEFESFSNLHPEFTAEVDLDICDQHRDPFGFSFTLIDKGATQFYADTTAGVTMYPTSSVRLNRFPRKYDYATSPYYDRYKWHEERELLVIRRVMNFYNKERNRGETVGVVFGAGHFPSFVDHFLRMENPPRVVGNLVAPSILLDHLSLPESICRGD